MSKETYLRFLRAYLTGRLPGGEVEEIMRYYTEYFEDAGQGREQEVMAELGSPEHLAQQILGQRGQEELAVAAAPVQEYGQEGSHAAPAYASTGHGGMPGWMFALLLAVGAIFAGPAILAVVFGLGLAGILCIVIGLGISVSGIGKLSFAGVIFQVGGGLITIAVGIVLLLGAVLAAWLTFRLIRWFRDIFVERSARNEEGY